MPSLFNVICGHCGSPTRRVGDPEKVISLPEQSHESTLLATESHWPNSEIMLWFPRLPAFFADHPDNTSPRLPSVRGKPHPIMPRTDHYRDRAPYTCG